VHKFYSRHKSSRKRAAKEKGTNPKEGAHFKEKFAANLEIFWLL
jgi:hypothetical protein